MRLFIINSVLASDFFSSSQRLYFYKKYFKLDAASDVIIEAGCTFTDPDLSKVIIESGAFINRSCLFDNGAPIYIGKNTFLGCQVSLITATHATGSAEKRVGYDCIRKLITIGDGCWIGSGVRVLPGVRIEDGVVVGAGALVNKVCADNGLYVGVPTRRLKDLD